LQFLLSAMRQKDFLPKARRSKVHLKTIVDNSLESQIKNLNGTGVKRPGA
jgi:hypothetical protein